MKTNHLKQANPSHSRRPRVLPVVLLLLLLSPFSYSQQKGIVEGKLVNRTDPSIIPRAIDLEVVALTEGMSIIKSTATDSAGKFRIEGLPENQRLMIRSNYQTANYYGQVSFNAEGKAYVEIDVFESTTSMKDIKVEGVRMAFQMTGATLKTLEVISFNNKTKPPRTYSNPEGNFWFSKAPGIMETPLIRVTAPGSSMPLVQAALESPDGKSYYSLYPLKPGITTFEVQEVLPYANRSYTYVKRFYQDIGGIDIGASPDDLVLSGPGLSKVQTNSQDNISVYLSGPIKAGSELVWSFSGGTPGSGTTEPAGEYAVNAMPNLVGRNALVIGPLILMGFVIALWYALNCAKAVSPKAAGSRTRQLEERGEHLLNHVAELDHKYETQVIGRQEFLRQREEGKRRLRRIFLLMRKS
jgi:hypothetical protein